MTGILGVSIADKLKKDILTDTEKSEDPQWCGFINNHVHHNLDSKWQIQNFV